MQPDTRGHGGVVMVGLLTRLRVKKVVWSIAVTVLGFVIFLALSDPEITARNAFAELIGSNFDAEAAAKSKVVGCEKKSFAARFHMSMPIRCTISTVCDRDIEIVVWTSPIAGGRIGPDSFAAQIARACASGLKKEIQKELESKLDVGG